MNTRMVQAIFDDENPRTRSHWIYPDTGRWDPERNVREFLAAMPVWRQHGILSFTVNFQGGSPEGYSSKQPWVTGAFTKQGKLKPAYAARMARVLDFADELGMVPIVGLFYFGQDEHLVNELAVKAATRNATMWLLNRGYQNVLLEIANEVDVKDYDHDIIKPPRVHELIALAQSIKRGGRRLLVGTSFGGGSVPTENVVGPSDFILIHGNGVEDPAKIAAQIASTRARAAYTPKPILYNEDDHFDFDKPDNNMMRALAGYTSWGYFDPGKSDYVNGFQCPPVNWTLNTPLKAAFARITREVTGF